MKGEKHRRVGFCLLAKNCLGATIRGRWRGTRRAERPMTSGGQLVTSGGQPVTSGGQPVRMSQRASSSAC
jgi:hypothetical protein